MKDFGRSRPLTLQSPVWGHWPWWRRAEDFAWQEAHLSLLLHPKGDLPAQTNPCSVAGLRKSPGLQRWSKSKWNDTERCNFWAAAVSVSLADPQSVCTYLRTRVWQLGNLKKVCHFYTEEAAVVLFASAQAKSATRCLHQLRQSGPVGCVIRLSPAVACSVIDQDAAKDKPRDVSWSGWRGGDST